MDYKKYQEARNASWELILDMGICELPVKITAVLRALEIPMHKYGESREAIKKLGLEELAKSSDGFTAYVNNKLHVFYNEQNPITRTRFTLAHELGHIVCGHITQAKWYTPKNTEPSDLDDLQEQQANIFASRLLAPACVLHELQLFTAEQIAEVCQISLTSATYRLKRLQILEKRNQEFLQQKGYGCYYLNRLEKEVYQQFKPYVDDNLKIIVTFDK